jgi:hypothetical protein
MINIHRKINILIKILLILNLSIFIVLGYGCENKDDVKEELTKERSVKVLILGDANINLPCPVKLKGVNIGEAVEKRLDEKGRPVIYIKIHEKNIMHLKKLSVFWINNDKKDSYLNYEILDDDSPPKKEKMVFIGFPSYSNFLIWRAKTLAKRGIEETLKTINKFVEDLSVSEK